MAGVTIFRQHAIQRMAERGITRADVEAVIKTGEVIREYPEDSPYPSRLILGWCDNRPLHVVAPDNGAAEETIIITVYEPTPDAWTEDFRRKKA